MNCEYEFLACLIGAITEKQENLIAPALKAVRPEFLTDKSLRRIYEIIIQNESLEQIFASLNGHKQIFFELLQKSHEILPVAAIPLAREIINSWRQREIKKLQKLYQKATDPDERNQLHRRIQEIEKYDPFDQEHKTLFKEFITRKALTPDDLNQEFDWLYEDLLLYGTYNIFFAPPSSGKSLFALSLAIHLLEEQKIKEVYYVDGDNSLIVLQKRGLKQILKNYPQLHYIKCNSAKEIREILEKLSEIEEENVLVVIDSLKDVAGADYSLDKSKEAKKIDELIKKVRDSNGIPKTVLVLHHVSKNSDQPTIFRAKNSTVFQDTADQTYLFKKINQDHEALYIELQEGKQRLSHRRFKFKVYFDHRFEEVDLILSKEEQDIIRAAREVLKNHRAALNFDELVSRVHKEYGLPHRKVFYTLKDHIDRFFDVKREEFPRRTIVSLKEWKKENSAGLQNLQNCRTIENQGFHGGDSPKEKPEAFPEGKNHHSAQGNNNSTKSLNPNSYAVLQKGKTSETIGGQQFCSSAKKIQFCRDCTHYRTIPKRTEGKCELLAIIRAPDYTRCKYFSAMQ